ncbi:uncharacterized protein LOC130723341 [Lotus japonicus]|uniref:uncharacterized protein LOC130723341 n=1 Tax=Lotus japonicus TaxID=34305 RepID=UPI0025851FAC|nr:uncharacterized protein LOC130723341 [Lotus japonicus]
MAFSLKPSSRYSSYDSRSSTSSHFSDPSSSYELTSNHHHHQKSSSSRALVKAKPSTVVASTKKVDPTLTTMVKRFMEKKPKAAGTRLTIPCDVIAQDLKKDAKKVAGFSALQKKLFGKGTASSSEKKKEKVKALTEVKGNTRTLAMVLRSERELLNINKEHEMEISQLKRMLEDKNKEVEKLKDLCLKQREEIKSLKSAVLFPDVMNSQLQDLVEKQGSELKQAKQVIPALQQQVSSLTGQLQSLAEDLAEVKADKYSAKAGLQGYGSSPRTPTHAREDASNSWDFSSEDMDDDLLLKDLNPCLTPCNVKSRSREFEGMCSGSLHEDSLSGDDAKICPVLDDFSSYDQKFSKSSDSCYSSNKISITSKAGRRSNERKSSLWR